MWNHMGNYGGACGGMGLGMIGMVLFWILLIVGIVALVKSVREPSRGGGQSQEKTALDLLKERYARGEIEKAEFDQKKRDLAA